MKYLTGYIQSPAVLTSTVDVSTARLCNNPVKYFTVKKFASLAIISQNPGFIEIQVLELFYSYMVRGRKTKKYTICFFSSHPSQMLYFPISKICPAPLTVVLVVLVLGRKLEQPSSNSSNLLELGL